MILQALYDYYQRKCAAPTRPSACPPTASRKRKSPLSSRSPPTASSSSSATPAARKARRVGRRYLVPQGVKKTSGIAANLLWDNLEYVTGVDTRGKPERVVEQHAAFRARINTLPASAQADPGLQAVQRFLDTLDVDLLALEPAFAEAKEGNAL
jgi:CRISPR-associated protein Csd1